MIRTLWSLLTEESRRKSYWHVCLSVLSLAARAVGAVLLIPAVSALFSDQPSQAWPWVIALAVVTAFGWIFDAAVGKLAYNIGFSLLETTQGQVAEQLTRFRLSWLNEDNKAVARQAIAATGPDIVGFIGNILTPLLTAISLPGFIGIALLPIAWPLGVAALLGIPVLVAAFWLLARLSERSDAMAETTNQRLTQKIIEFAKAQQALRAARRLDGESASVSQALAQQHSATIKQIFTQVPGQILFNVVSQMVLFLLAGTTIVLALQDQLTPAEAIAAIAVIVRYLEPFSQMGQLSGVIATSSRILDKIRTVLQAPTNENGTMGQHFPEPLRIELDGVSFAYGADQSAVVGNINLTLEPGSVTAIVGPSGSGKSTLLALLAGVQHPTGGMIRVDGVDVRELDEESRRALVSMVFQEPYLFEGTVEENVRSSKPESSTEELAHVAQQTRLGSVLQALPQGWNSSVGDSGQSLSGGERQRISIARALLKPAPLLLIDEGTSALDAENEVAVTAALSEPGERRTRVIVAHRLGSIAHADRILFVQDGQIVEDGTPEELLGQGGRFAQFWDHQQQTATWRL